MASNTRKIGLSLLVCLSLAVAGRAMAEGNDAHDVDTTGLPKLGSNWLAVNPYRGTPNQETARKIGDSAFNQNCARCHGLDAISGGIAPDLRYLDKGADGDAWFINRIRNGYSLNGITRMPRWEGVLSQETMWSIRTYLDSRYQDN